MANSASPNRRASFGWLLSPVSIHAFFQLFVNGRIERLTGWGPRALCFPGERNERTRGMLEERNSGEEKVGLGCL